MSDSFDVIMAAYTSAGPAHTDFDALVGLVKEKKVATEGVILVEHDAVGEVRVSQTGDHLGRKGMGWGGGVGLVVGLLSPPLLTTVVVGSAAGGLIGNFAEHLGEAGLFGSRSIYKDGWWACAKLDKAPWDLSPRTMKRYAPDVHDPARDTWELYYLPDDFSQAHDLAADNPGKLAKLQDLWWAEAERNRVLPLLGGLSVFFGILPPMPTATRFAFAGDVQNIQRGMVPRIYGRSYAIEADLNVPDSGAEGALVANADFIGGFGLWVDASGKLNHSYSFLGADTCKQVSTEKIPAGDVTVRILFQADRPKPGTGGTVTLWANDKQIGESRIDHTVPVAFSSYAGMDIGRDNGLVAYRAYEDKTPYPFTGTVRKVTFDLKPEAPGDEKALHQHAQLQAVGHGAAG